MTARPIVARTGRALACASLLVVSFGLASAHAATKFGSDLKRHGGVIRPQWYERECAQEDPFLDNGPCDRVAVRFLATGGQHRRAQHRRAPKTGTIKELRLVARFSGSFEFELAKVKRVYGRCGDSGCDGKAKIVHRGPKIHYVRSGHGPGNYRIQRFPVHVHVRKGEYLGIRANTQSLYSCKRYSPVIAQQLIFQPPLPIGGPFGQRDGYSDCTLLLQAVYKED
jgi:hypothetical protein